MWPKQWGMGLTKEQWKGHRNHVINTLHELFIHRKRVSLRFFLFSKQEVFLQSFFYGVILILNQPNCLQKYEPIFCYNLRVIIPEHFPEIFVLTFLVAYVRNVTNFYIVVPFFFLLNKFEKFVSISLYTFDISSFVMVLLFLSCYCSIYQKQCESRYQKSDR